MFRQLSLVAAPLAWLVTAATLLAQADPLAVIPDDALGVTVVYNIADTSARVGKVAAKMQIPAPDLLGLAKSFAGVEKGLDEKGSVAAALFVDPSDEEGFGVAILIPVTDYKEFIGQFEPDDADGRISKVKVIGQEALVARKDSFAVFTLADQKELLERVLTSTKNVTTVIEPLRAWAAEQQAAVLVTPKGKSLLFEKLLTLIPDLPANAAEPEQANLLAGAAEGVQIIKHLLAAADEQLTHLAVGARINDNASFRVSFRLPFAPEGKLAAWAKNVPPPPAAMLAGLPTGKYVFAYSGVSPNDDGEFWGLMSQFGDMALRQFNMSDEGRKKTAEAIARQHQGVQSTCGLLGTGMPAEGLFSTSIVRVKNAEEYLKASRTMFEIMQAEVKSRASDKPIYELHEVTLEQFEALELVTNLDALAGAGGPQAGMMKMVLGKMFGADGKMRTYLAAANEHTVVSAFSKSQLERAVVHVRSGEKGLESDPEMARTTAMLMNGSQWVAYVNPQGLVEWVELFMRGILAGQNNNFRLPGFAPTEPIGLAAKIAPSGLEAEIVVPESVVAGIGQFISAVQGMFRAGAAPPPP